MHIDDRLMSASNDYKKQYDEIVRYRRLQHNIATAIDSISMCLPMLEKYNRLHEQMNAKRRACWDDSTETEIASGIIKR